MRIVALMLLTLPTLFGCVSYSQGPWTNANAQHPAYMPTTASPMTYEQQMAMAAPPPAPNYMVQAQPNQAYAPKSSGSLFRANNYQGLFTDTRAFRVGDVISVVLEEQTQASTRSATSASKDSGVALGAPIFGTNAAPALQASADSSRTVSGSGNTSQSAQLSGELTVTVAQVLPNGNLVVRGEKRLTINQGLEHLRISGIVRPNDIRPDNTVISTKVANAHVEYASKGLMASANEPGWATKFLFSNIWPL